MRTINLINRIKYSDASINSIKNSFYIFYFVALLWRQYYRSRVHVS